MLKMPLNPNHPSIHPLNESFFFSLHLTEFQQSLRQTIFTLSSFINVDCVRSVTRSAEKCRLGSGALQNKPTLFPG